MKSLVTKTGESKQSKLATAKAIKGATGRRAMFNVRRDGDRFYIPIPKDLGSFFDKKRLYFLEIGEAEASAKQLNLTYEEELSKTKVKHALEYLHLLREKGYPGGIVDIMREKCENFDAVATEPTFVELQRKLINDLTSRKRREQSIDNIRQFHVPWPNLRLIELSSRKLRREKIEWLKVFLGDQIDFRTGEPWREATKRAYVNRLSQIINYAINNSETDLTFNPFSKSVAFSVEWDPEIFALEEIELFLTYLYHWYPKLYIPFVLATWGGIRTGELKRMTYRAIKLNSPGCGWIKLDRNITKMKKTRTIREMRVQHLFTLLRAAPLGMGADDAKLVEGADWESDLFAAWRELMFKPFPHNGMRHTAASMLLEARGMETCARILGHDFRDTDKVLLDHYRSLVDPDMVKRFYEMLPQRDLTLEREAAYKYRLYTGWIDGAATTRLWPNCRMHYMHQMNTGSVDFVRNLRAKRPIFATAVGKSLEIEILHPDGRPEKLIIPCQRKLWAKKLEHRWRVAIYTGQGVLNFENGQVEHYVANFGALWGEKLYLLDNPEALLEAVKECREGVKPIARKVGCSTDILCDYMNPTRTKWVKARVIPGKFKKRLLALFPDLIFIPYTPKNDTMAWVSAGVDDVENAPNHLIGLSGSVTKSRLSLTCST